MWRAWWAEKQIDSFLISDVSVVDILEKSNGSSNVIDERWPHLGLVVPFGRYWHLLCSVRKARLQQSLIAMGLTAMSGGY